MHPIKVHRARAGLTILALAERSGVSRETISRIEHGHNEPSAPTLKKLAGALGVDVREIMEAPNLPKAPGPSLPPFNEWLKRRHPDAAFRELEELRRVLEGGRPQAFFVGEEKNTAEEIDQLSKHLAEYATELRLLAIAGN